MFFFFFAVFKDSGFKRSGSKWDPTNGITGEKNAFNNLGDGDAKSTARYGCCPANKYMSFPEGTGAFTAADSCSACSAGTKVSHAASVLNDETSCELCERGKSSTAGSTSCDLITVKMPDGCTSKVGKWWEDRLCYPRKAVDDFIAGGTLKDSVVLTYGLIQNWDMSLVTDLSNLLYKKYELNADLSNWDVSRVTNMAYGK